jgi:transcriptional regulator with XRE-family HTH domain
MKKISEKIGEKIKQVREKQNLTQQSMADELGITSNGYGKIERGDSAINLDKLEKIAEILKVKLEDLMDLEKSVVALTDNKIKNITDNKIASIIICEVSEKERELYEAQISQLKDENHYLRALVEKLTVK